MKQLLIDFKNKIKNLKLFSSIQFKVTLLASIFVSVASTLLIIFIFSLNMSSFKLELQDKLKMLASNTAVSIDAEMLKIVTSQLDESTTEYKTLHNKLNEIQDATNHKIKYIYTLAKTKENKYIYILDATPLEDTENHSAIGSIFPIEEFPDAVNGFIEATAEKDPIPDKEFNTISQSAYAPIKDNSGNVVGIVGLDMDVSVLKKEESNIIRALIITLCICLIISIFIGIFLSKYLTTPIISLTKGAAKVAGGDLDFSISIDRHDEIGQLTSSFNTMIQNVKLYQDELKKYNTELEQEIELNEKKYNDNINDIIEIINMDHEIFQFFIDECNQFLEELEQKFIQLRNDRNNYELLNDITRIMHTIKGNSRAFNLNRIASEAHEFETIFDAIRTDKKALTDRLLTDIFAKLDNFNQLFKETLDLYYKVVRSNTANKSSILDNNENHNENSDIVRVRTQDLDKLTELFYEAENLIRHDNNMAVIELAKHDSFNEIESVLHEAVNQLKLIKMVPINKLFDKLPRIALDLSVELNKKVNLIINSDSFEIEKNVYEKLKDSIIHILRNSIDHGIEGPYERINAGKPHKGTVEIKTFKSSSEIIIEIKDDGRGIDLEEVKLTAVIKGIISSDKINEISDDEALEFIFIPGFSTNNEITDISGRGVGMDIVKTIIEKDLHGKLFLESEKNKGLKVIINIPV